MVTFAFGGTELVGLAAAETANPRKSLPAATKQVFWRITLFYFLTLALIGLTVPHDDPRLSSGSSNVDARASPFAIAIERAGIDGLPSVMNAVILTAVLAVGNSAVYASTRSLAALANLRHAPKFLGIVDRKGRPMIAIGVAFAFGLLAFIANLPEQGEVLDWLMAISGISTLVTWGSICLCHIRFRKAWAAQEMSVSQLPTRSRVGVVGSYIGLGLNIAIMAAQLWTTIDPVDAEEKDPGRITRDAFLRWLGAPILILCFMMHKLWYKTTYVRIKSMDVDTGRRRFSYYDDVCEEEIRRTWPRWKRIYKILC
jgi:yeast amino acid transporter